MKKKHILLILTSGLGNCVLALPAIAELRRNFPDHLISVAGPAVNTDLLGSSMIADEWIVIPKNQSIMRYLITHPLYLFRHYSYVFSFFSSNPGRLILLKKIGLVDHIYSIRHPSNSDYEYDIFFDGREDLHEAEQNLNLLRKADISVQNSWADLHLTTEENMYGRCYLEQRGCNQASLIIHPSWTETGMPKSLPVDFVSELMSRLRNDGIKTFLLLGPEEQRFFEKCQDVKIPSEEIICEKFTMRQLAGVLSCAKLMLSADSGPGHIASAAGVKVITVWLDSNPVRCAVAGKEKAIHIFPNSYRRCQYDNRDIELNLNGSIRENVKLTDIFSIIRENFLP